MKELDPDWIIAANFALWVGVGWMVRHLARNPRGRTTRLLLTSWGARPRKRFDPLTRRDRLRTAGWTMLAGVVALAVSFGAFTASEGLPSLSTVGMLFMGIGFVGFLLAAMAAVGAILMLLAALFVRSPRPRRFTITSHGMAIGSSDLEGVSEPHQLIYGLFQPVREFRSVYHVFEEWIRACAHRVGEVSDDTLAQRYIADLHALELRVLGPAGPIALPAVIHIEDVTVPNGVDRLQVQIVSTEFERWRRELDLARGTPK